jgi:thymidylate synthase (FAD)
MTAVNIVWSTPKAEELIVYMARVSAPKNQTNIETSPKLLKYLIKHKHWSPFEMANMCVEVNTTRAIAPQILRHRSFSFQEFSQRYANTTELDKASPIQLRRQDTKNRQNSIDDLGEEKTIALNKIINDLFCNAEDTYNFLLEQGVAKECARNVLPLATPTKLYMNGTLRSWLHYIDLRTGPETQLEHREIAEQCKQIFVKEFPTIGKAMWDHLDEPSQSRLFF